MRFIIASVLLLLSSPVWADSKPSSSILLWGFQRGCKPLTDITRVVQEAVDSNVAKPDGQTYALLPDSKLLSCQGQSCAALVRRSCPNASGRILGGMVEQTASLSVTRVRLWLYDPQTGQTAYHDNYCQNCDMTNALTHNAVQIAQHPEFGQTPDATPMYCRADSDAMASPTRSGKLFWVVYGKDHYKPAILATVRKLVEAAGGEVQFQHKGEEYTLPVLKKVASRDPGSQVFGADIQDKGIVELFLYDDKTERTEVQRVECEACDKDALAEKVRQTAVVLLAHCFGDNCAQVGRSHAPAEACQPFEIPRCGDLPLAPDATGSNAAGGPLSGPEISPRLAKLTKGTVWGLFAAGAATTAALLIANSTSAGQYMGTTFESSNRLLGPALAAGGLTLVALGVAIPTTIIVNRATPKPTSTSIAVEPGHSAEPALMQCPN
jgi:hypothetical protein